MADRRVCRPVALASAPRGAARISGAPVAAGKSGRLEIVSASHLSELVAGSLEREFAGLRAESELLRPDKGGSDIPMNPRSVRRCGSWESIACAGPSL